MEESERNHYSEDKKLNFIKIGSYASAIILLLTAGYWVGTQLQVYKTDRDKQQLERQNVQLSDSILRLQSIILNDSINKKNWLQLNTHYLLFNNDSLDLPPITVSNSAYPCEIGDINGCWKTEISARPCDIVCVQIWYKNTGQFSVENVALGYTFQYSRDRKTVVCKGGIAVGNTIAREGSAHIFLNKPSKLTFLSEGTQLYRNRESQSENIKQDTAFGSPAFKIGTVNPGSKSQGALVLRFRVEED